MTLRLAHVSDIHFGGENGAAVSACADYINSAEVDLVVIQLRRDLNISASSPERCYATSRSGERHRLVSRSHGGVAAPAGAARATTRLRSLARRLRSLTKTQ